MTINGAGMPGYSEKAQPYLDAIGAAVLSSAEVRDWILTGIPGAIPYLGSTPVADEQRAKRGATKQPFWANYWCGRDSRCTCRIEGSKALESDAIFFFRNTEGRTLGLHVEFKHPLETFGYGQPEGYPLRAACFAKTGRAGRRCCRTRIGPRSYSVAPKPFPIRALARFSGSSRTQRPVNGYVITQ